MYLRKNWKEETKMKNEDIHLFLKKESGKTIEDLRRMTDCEYDRFTTKVLCVEAEENIKCDGNPLSRRGKLAGEVLDLMYTD